MTPEYEIKDGVLVIYKELDYDYDVMFDRACSELVMRPETDLVIDLSRISRITSTYIGLMAAAYFQAKSHGKELSIICKGPVWAALNLAGFANFMVLIDTRSTREIQTS